MKSLATEEQNTWIKLYTHVKETSETARATAIMVPDAVETPVSVTEIAQSSGEQSFDQLQSCSRQLEHLKIGFRKVWETGWSGKLL